MKSLLSAGLLALALPLAGCATTMAASTDYAAALADPARPAADRERDAVRLPAELLAFAGIERGDRVGDWWMGGGYLTRALAATVGPQGHVYAFQPDEYVARRPQTGIDQKTVDEAYANVDAVHGSMAAAAFPAGLDAIVTVQNFHDLYHPPAPADFAARAAQGWFAALRPGGTLTIVDHSAAPGSGTRDSDKLHRIDKQTVIAVVTAAGFKLDGDGALFANPADPRDKTVFDPSIRGHTDQFALRFRKPK
jgi:predicted methyltransferase